MLVTYRRVKSSEHSPTSSDDRKPRPPLHKANTITSLHPTSQGSRIVPHIAAEPEPSFAEDDSGDTETELPEVALDRNTHIVPHWLFKHNQADNRKLRAASMSRSELPSGARPYLSPGAMARRKFGDATLSTPDLCAETRFCPQPSPLSTHTTLPSAAPTPGNSPRNLGRFLNTIGERDHRTASTPPISPNGISPIGPNSVCGFGGTGSTVVNTKLKDHIFSTILKRMTKRHRHSTGRRWRVDEEGDAADTEGESGMSPRKRPTIIANDLPVNEDDHSRGPSDGGYRIIRRTYSEDTTVIVEKAKTMGGVRKSDDPPSLGHGDVFHMELDSAEEDVHLKQTLGSSFLPLARKRSLSRSIGPGPGVSILPSHPSLAIPRGRCDSKTSVPPLRELPTHPNFSPANVESSPTSTTPSSPRQNHFILMEDLTGKLKTPCVLDLKMGTRQYGMDATPGKKKSQRKKCDRTTSRSLGVRVCGMQVSWTRLLYIPRDWRLSVCRVAASVLVAHDGTLPFSTLGPLSHLPAKRSVANVKRCAFAALFSPGLEQRDPVLRDSK